MRDLKLVIKTDSITVVDAISMKDIYNDYLEFARNCNDEEDYEEESENKYYDIANKEIYVYLKQELPDKYINLFIEIIKSFFDLNVLWVFENYIYLKRFGTLASSTNEVKLLSVELKRDKEMVKKYV